MEPCQRLEKAFFSCPAAWPPLTSELPLRSPCSHTALPRRLASSVNGAWCEANFQSVF